MCFYTGLAASLLVNGRTSHAVFGIPAEDLDESSESSLSLHSEAGQELRDCSVIIWDEVAQSSRLQSGLVDKVLRVLTGKLQFTMGGKVVVFVGDFRQTTLVPPMFGGRSYIVENSVRRSPVWAHVKKYTLTQNMRAIHDTDEFRQ